MKQMSTIALVTLSLLGASASSLVQAQVAGGSTSVDVTIVESTQLALGWSVKKTLLGKTVYNGAGQKIGKVEDLIISPDKSVSYLIIGAGGFIGIGRHDVAIPVNQIQDQAGKLVMPGATQDTIKAMPAFTYANDTARRDQFVATAEKDIAKGKEKLAALQKQAGSATSEAKAKLDAQVTALQADLKAAEAKLTEMKQAAALRWKEFEAGVSAATARLRKAIDSATT